MKKLTIKLLGLAVLAIPFFTSCEDEGGEEPKSDVVVNLEKGIMNGSLEENYTLDASVTYTLTGTFLVKEGAKLTIPAGTKVLVDTATGVPREKYIAVLMGGKIEINGTAANPVVMGSKRTARAKNGDWGGILICGKAKSTAGVNVEAEVGGLLYAGTDTTDNSGTINYLVLLNSGTLITEGSQFNGLSLYAVGSGTSISNVSVKLGTDDGVEFFGGSVSVSNIYLEDNDDDAIDWTEGWNGTVTNSYVMHTMKFSTVVEADKENGHPKLINLTAVSTVGGTALQFKAYSGAVIENINLSGYDKIIDMIKADNPLSEVMIDGAPADTTASYNTGTKVDVSGWTWKDATL
ncbi:MAG: hypothetical protein JW870_00865 [Candidatus Delongbacteria bacterium]|nr:hypothetical protein [Candidatus Delongbacteria bacterium]MBN2821084.1 hypothetical protein [Bacteroidales bacterium]